VTLVNRKGYVRQRLTPEGDQVDLPDEWDPKKHMRELSRRVTVRIGDANVTIRAWLYDYWSPVGGLVPVLFLDTDLPENAPEDRGITDHLYGGDQECRLKKAIVLGIGGARMLTALDIKVGKYHINESHSSLLTLELLRRPGMDEEKVQTHCIFTTHTPVAVAFEKFPRDMVVHLLEGEIPPELLDRYIARGGLALATLAFRLSRYINGVTTAHMNFSRQLFPGFHIRAVTNGVHPHTWTSVPFRNLYDRYISGWAQEPELLARVDTIPREEIRHAHQQAKQALVNYVKEKNNVDLDPRALTIGFARRAAAYKRATLLFSDLDRLREASRKGAIQLVFSGKDELDRSLPACLPQSVKVREEQGCPLVGCCSPGKPDRESPGVQVHIVLLLDIVHQGLLCLLVGVPDLLARDRIDSGEQFRFLRPPGDVAVIEIPERDRCPRMRVDAVRHRPDVKPGEELSREVHVRRRHTVDVPAQAKRKGRECKPAPGDVPVEQFRRDLALQQVDHHIARKLLERHRHRGMGGEDTVRLHLLLIHPRTPEEFEGEET